MEDCRELSECGALFRLRRVALRLDRKSVV